MGFNSGFKELIMSLQDPTISQDPNSFFVLDVNYLPFAHPNTRYIYGSLRQSKGRESETSQKNITTASHTGLGT